MRRKDYWKLALARFEQAKGLFTILPIKHSEKVRRKGLAIGISLGDSWSSVEPKVIALRKEIHTERNGFVLEAEKQYKIGHPGSSEPVGS